MTALMIWKGLSAITNNESPVVVVLSESMSPAFERGDILFLTMFDDPIVPGDICVFNIKGRDIPIVHRVIKIHEDEKGNIKVLTKGDHNQVHDRGLYNPGQMWLDRNDIVGRVKGYMPYMGMVTIIMNDYPKVKYAILGLLAMLVLFNREFQKSKSKIINAILHDQSLLDGATPHATASNIAAPNGKSATARKPAPKLGTETIEATRAQLLASKQKLAAARERLESEDSLKNQLEVAELRATISQRCFEALHRWKLGHESDSELLAQALGENAKLQSLLQQRLKTEEALKQRLEEGNLAIKTRLEAIAIRLDEADSWRQQRRKNSQKSNSFSDNAGGVAFELDPQGKTDPKSELIQKTYLLEMYKRENEQLRNGGAAAESAPEGELQDRLARLTLENAQLTLDLQAERHKNEMISNELETIPQYISQYHEERNSFKTKFRELESEIATLRLERRALITAAVPSSESPSSEQTKLVSLASTTAHRSSRRLGDLPKWTGCASCQGPLFDV